MNGIRGHICVTRAFTSDMHCHASVDSRLSESILHERYYEQLPVMSKILFSTIEVTRQAFYRTPLTCAIVNLKPIVPGRTYVLVTNHRQLVCLLSILLALVHPPSACRCACHPKTRRASSTRSGRCRARGTHVVGSARGTCD